MSSPKQDWKRPAVLAAILLALVVYTAWRAVPERSNIDRLEVQLTSYPVEGMGDGPVPVKDYARYYADARAGSDPALRAAIPASGRLPKGKAVIVGVLVKPGAGDRDRPGVRRVRLSELPIIGDGGCTVIDVIYDPGRDDILDARCHGQLRAPPPPIPPLAGG